MDMAFAARGDFLALSGVASARVAADAGVFEESAGALVMLEAVLAAVVTVLVTGFAGLVFLIGSAFLVAGFFAGGVAFFFTAAVFAAGFLLFSAANGTSSSESLSSSSSSEESSL